MNFITGGRWRHNIIDMTPPSTSGKAFIGKQSRFKHYSRLTPAKVNCATDVDADVLHAARCYGPLHCHCDLHGQRGASRCHRPRHLIRAITPLRTLSLYDNIPRQSNFDSFLIVSMALPMLILANSASFTRYGYHWRMSFMLRVSGNRRAVLWLPPDGNPWATSFCAASANRRERHRRCRIAVLASDRVSLIIARP